MNTIDILSIHDIIISDHNTEECLSTSPDKSFSGITQNEKWKNLYNEISDNTSHDVLSDVKAQFSTDHKKLYQNFNFYLIEVVQILDEFVTCRKNIQKISFFRSQNDSINNDKHKIQEVVDKYIKIVKYYFPKQYDKHWTMENDKILKRKKIKLNSIKQCQNCFMESDNFVIADNHTVCSGCGNVISMTSDNLISFRDIERINIGSKYTYDRKTHFKECIKRFQGKQNVNIPPKLFEDVVKQLIDYYLIPENYTDYEKNKCFEKVRREHIQIILKDLGYSKYYEDIVYIYHKITGHEIPDITHLENNLMNDFDSLLETYDNTDFSSVSDKDDNNISDTKNNVSSLLISSKKGKNDRKNFINNQYVLYQLLRKYKYNCRKEDFQFLKTNDRKYYHDVICQILFEKLGWNFSPVF
jgi:hypothetical protein